MITLTLESLVVESVTNEFGSVISRTLQSHVVIRNDDRIVSVLAVDEISAPKLKAANINFDGPVSYTDLWDCAMTGKTITIENTVENSDLYKKVKAIYDFDHNKIAAIKEYRTISGKLLVEAKNEIEKWIVEYEWNK